MTEFIKNNKFTIHIVTEIICMCGIVMFINRNNKSIYEHFKYIEDKLEMYKKKIEDQDNVIELLKRKVIYFDNVLTTKNERPPPPQPQDVFEFPERVIIEQVLQQQLRKKPKHSVVIEETEPDIPPPIQHPTPLPFDEPSKDYSHEEDLDKEIEKELNKIKSNNEQETIQKTNQETNQEIQQKTE